MQSLNRLQPWALLLLRALLGIAMAVAGFHKLIPVSGLSRAHPLAGFEVWNHSVAALGLPYWLGYVSLLTELLGGLLLLFGLLTRLAAFLVACEMLVALVEVDLRHGFAASELPLFLMIAALLLITTGPGALALDRRVGLG